MELGKETKELDRLMPIFLGKLAHLEDLVGTEEYESELMLNAEELLADVRRACKAAGLVADPS